MPGLRGVALALIFAALVAVSFERWGHARADLGGALDRTARVAAGELLYRDVESPYGPLPDYAVAAGFRLAGTRLAVAWTIGLLLIVAESALLLTIARRFCSPAQCFVGVVGFWVLFAFAPGLFGWVLPNTFASTFGATGATLALALAIAARERASMRLFVAASVAAAAAGLSKVDNGFAAALAVVAAACLAPPHVNRARLLVAAVLPGLVVAGAVLALFGWLVAWDVLVFDNLYRVRSLGRTLAALRAGVPAWTTVLATSLLPYAVEMPLRAAMVAWGLALAGGGIRRAIGIALATTALALPLLPGYPGQLDFTLLAAGIGFAWTPLAWLVVTLLALPGARRGETAPAALALAGLWSVALALRWDLRLVWPSYYGVLAPFVLLFVVGRLASLLVRVPTTLAAAGVVAVPIVLLAAANAEHYRTQYRFALSYPRGTLRTAMMEGQPLAKVIDHIRAHTEPADWVAVFPEERLINFLSERRHPTRDSGTGPGWLATPEDEAECVAQLEKRRPRLVVLSDRRWPEFGAGDLGSYNPLLRAWIDREYEPVLTTAPHIVRYTILAPRGSDSRARAGGGERDSTFTEELLDQRQRGLGDVAIEEPRGVRPGGEVHDGSAVVAVVARAGDVERRLDRRHPEAQGHGPDRPVHGIGQRVEHEDDGKAARERHVGHAVQIEREAALDLCVRKTPRAQAGLPLKRPPRIGLQRPGVPEDGDEAVEPRMEQHAAERDAEAAPGPDLRLGEVPDVVQPHPHDDDGGIVDCDVGLEAVGDPGRVGSGEPRVHHAERRARMARREHPLEMHR